jgi:soluble lytic murein transglycosylase
MKIFAFLVAVLFLSPNVFAQDSHAKIRAAIESRDYQTAVNELELVKKSERKTFEANNYDYLLARAAERRGDFAAAMANYQAVVNRKSVLREYALWHLAQIARSSGNLLLERNYLRELLTVAPHSLLKNAARERLARSFFESKDYDAAIKSILEGEKGRKGEGENSSANDQQPTDNQPATKFELSREHLVLLGQSYLASGKTTEARQTFTKLVENLPNPAQPDDFALAAVRGLDALDGAKENFGKIAPALADAEHFRRARIYQFNRDFKNARLHFAAIVERFPESPNLPESLYQTGRGYALENDFQAAVKWFERVVAEFPNDAFARDGLSQAASAYARVNKPREAITRYKQYIEKYPNEPNVERAFLNIVDILRDLGEETEALDWTRRAREVFKGDLPEAVALFAQARIRFAQNDWTNALADLSELEKFSDLGGTRVPGGTNEAEVKFLRAYALEQAQRQAEAIDVYLSIPDGRASYYGWRATERIRAIGNDEKTRRIVENKIAGLKISAARTPDENRRIRQSLYRLTGEAEYLKNIREIYAQLPAYKQTPGGKLLEFGRREVLKEERKSQSAPTHQILADELLFLGLYDEATPELETALREKLTPTTSDKLKDLVGIKTNNNNLAVFPPDTAYTLAVFYKRGDMANRAVAYVEPLWRSVPADFQIELIPREQLELLYPAPYADALLRHAPERNVDPRFLLSIMRQESRYRADVKSNAAARGLMQFISDTADRIAGELGRKNFAQDELYNPQISVLFGAQYLSNLFRMFPDQPPAVAASYNGGETNMSRWLARAKSPEADRYVPEILFSQSKDYVYKVMANYRVYQMLYDERLKVR